MQFDIIKMCKVMVVKNFSSGIIKNFLFNFSAMVAALEKDVNFSVEMVIATVDSDNYIFEPNLCSQLLVESDQHFSFRERQSLSNDISSVPENERQKFDHSHGVALKIIDHIQKLPSLCDTNSSRFLIL